MEIPDQYCSPFHESSNRPHLIVGCEPTPIAAALFVCVVIGFSAPKWWGIAGAVFLFLFLRQILREMAKEDPILLTVHHESQRYNRGFWTAKPRQAHRWRS
jgi:type IV secretory pathway TrbD component